MGVSGGGGGRGRSLAEWEWLKGGLWAWLLNSVEGGAANKEVGWRWAWPKRAWFVEAGVARVTVSQLEGESAVGGATGGSEPIRRRRGDGRCRGRGLMWAWQSVGAWPRAWFSQVGVATGKVEPIGERFLEGVA